LAGAGAGALAVDFTGAAFLAAGAFLATGAGAFFAGAVFFAAGVFFFATVFAGADLAGDFFAGAAFFAIAIGPYLPRRPAKGAAKGNRRDRRAIPYLSG
jgi:hypothetical protein